MNFLIPGLVLMYYNMPTAERTDKQPIFFRLVIFMYLHIFILRIIMIKKRNKTVNSKPQPRLAPLAKIKKNIESTYRCRLTELFP